MMRFEVNQTYPFIATTFNYGGDSDRVNNIGYECFIPWRDELTELHLRVLTCIEHHKVRDANAGKDAEPTCDGFIFRDEADGSIWYNQYPVAHYGQISTRGDHMVHRHVETNDPLTIRDRMDARERLGFELLSERLESILDPRNAETLEASERTQLASWYQQIVDALQSKTGMTAEVRDHEMPELTELGYKRVIILPATVHASA